MCKGFNNAPLKLLLSFASPPPDAKPGIYVVIPLLLPVRFFQGF